MTSFTYSVTASNGVPPNATAGPFTVAVSEAPAFIADSPPAVATVGTPYTYTFTASGNPAPTFSVASGQVPNGLTLSAAGVLSGVPTIPGPFTFAVRATNSAGFVISPVRTITVQSTSHAPVFTADTPPTHADDFSAYSYTFMATGIPAPTFSLASGSLPSGLALNHTTGLLTGTPTAVGTFTFRIRATNSAGQALTPPITITVTYPVWAYGGSFNATAGVPATVYVGLFIDVDSQPVSAYTVTINWGDATSSSGTVMRFFGSFYLVSASHTYAHAGSFAVTTTIVDADGSTTSVHSTASVH